MFHHVQRVREFAVLHRRTGLQQAFERGEKLFRAFDAVRRAVELDPALARRGLDAKFRFEQL